MRRSDQTIVGSHQLPRNTHIADFWWVGDQRLMFGLAERFGARDFPSPTGVLFAMNVDGSRPQLLVGWRVRESSLGTNIRSSAKEEFVHAWPIDLLPDDPRNVLVAVSPFSKDPLTRVDRMDVQTGRRTTIATAPVYRGQFLADHAGEILRPALDRVQVAGIGAEQRGDLRARRVACDVDTLRVAALFARMVQCPAHRACGIAHEGREAGRRPGAIVSDDRHDAVLRQPAADEAVLRARAHLPGAAVEEQHHGRLGTCVARPVDVEGEISGRVVDHRRVGLGTVPVDEAEERALAAGNEQREQGGDTGAERSGHGDLLEVRHDAGPGPGYDVKS